MSDFTLSPPILAGAAILCNAPPLVFQPPPLPIIIAQSLRQPQEPRWANQNL